MEKVSEVSGGQPCMDIPAHTTAKQLIFSSFCYFSPLGLEDRTEPAWGHREGGLDPRVFAAPLTGFFQGARGRVLMESAR